MQVGLKFFPESLDKILPEIDRIRESADFLEIMAIRGTDFSRFEKLAMPVTIHAEHHGFGVNPANPDKEADTLDSLLFAIKTADTFSSDVIVVHPGHRENKKCSVQQIAKVLNSMGDKRIVMENLVPNFTEDFYFTTPENMNYLLEKTGLPVCLDSAHASLTAQKLGRDVLEFYRKMNNLKPKYYHFSDTKLESGKDMHLHIGKGNLPLGRMKMMLPENVRVCLEIPTDLDGMLKDLEYFRKL